MLVGGLFFVQVGADRESRVRVNRAIALLDVLDDAVLIDDDVGALRPLVSLVFLVVVLQNAVGSEHFLIHIAQQRELYIDLLGEGGVRGWAIHAYAKNFRVGGIDLACAYSRLDRLELLGSTTGERQDVNRQEDVFLSAIIAELDRLPLIAEQTEIGSRITNLEGNLGYLGFLGLRGGGS